jgi:hypothetical protein
MNKKSKRKQFRWFVVAHFNNLGMGCQVRDCKVYQGPVGFFGHLFDLNK